MRVGFVVSVLAVVSLVVRVGSSQGSEETPTPEPTLSPGARPAYGSTASASKVFNPDVAVIGDFLGAAGKNDTVFATPSLELHEAETSFQAVVDPHARADFFLTFGKDEVGVQEAFVTLKALPANFTLKVGKMRASFGKVNQMHDHVMPWTDRPIVTQDLAGGEDGISDEGLSLSRLFPSSLLCLEATGEVYRGESNVFHAPRRRDLTYVARLRAYRDLAESTKLDFGGSVAAGHNDVAAAVAEMGGSPDGLTTRLIGVDATLRFRPTRRATYRRFIARTELVWSRRRDVAADVDSFGYYVAAEYQFGRSWFAGGRWDHSERPRDASLVDKGPSVVLTYWPSEFGQVRGQYRHLDTGEGERTNELQFQLQFSIGTHGAHTF